MFRQATIDKLEDVINKSANLKFARPILRVRPLTYLRDSLKKRSDFMLDHNELSLFYLLVTEAFHDDLEHKALSVLVNRDELAPFLLLKQTDLLNFNNVSQFCKLAQHPEKNRIGTASDLLSNLAAAGWLSQHFFDLIFNDYDFNPARSVPFHIILYTLLVQFHHIQPLSFFEQLAQNEDRAREIYMFLTGLLDSNLLTPEVNQALGEEIEHLDAIKSLLNYMVNMDPQLKGAVVYFPALIRSAKYIPLDLFVVLDLYIAFDLNDIHNLSQLFHMTVFSKGDILSLVRLLIQDNEDHLISPVNLVLLTAVLAYKKTISAALAVLNWEEALTQDIFNLITQKPIDALFIVANKIGIDWMRHLGRNEDFIHDFPDEAATLRSFVDLATAARFFEGPVRRIIKQSPMTLFTNLPTYDILKFITAKVVESGTLEPEVIQYVINSCRPRGRKQLEAENAEVLEPPTKRTKK